ncbi:MAG: hypothetical protein JW839_00415 [Candidatus Lokiarchaeota archaeon]|nr:hypothetical protein [Candidatus Lokiarchaeota archaeon]
MMLAWRLEDIDFAIIGILICILLLTFIWRNFFRWDTLYGLKQRGTNQGMYRAFEPPLPRQDGAAIAVLEGAALDPRRRGTWLVQGLLAAGFRVLLLRSVGNAADAMRDARCVALVHHGSFAHKEGEVAAALAACIEGTASCITPLAVIVNEGGTPGMKAAIEGVAMAMKGDGSLRAECHLITCTKAPALDAELAGFHDTLVVRRSKASLRDAELQAIGCMLKWVGS